MTYIDTNARSTKVMSNEMQIPLGRQALLNGLYMGFVKDATDVQRNGRLRVWIPELGSAPAEDKNWIIVNYCSPFAGATSVNSASNSNTQSFEGTQTSYGMWMIPPDIDNVVLIMFINGSPSQGVWIGCLYNQFMNQMVPGMAADINSYQYTGKNVPLAEYNKNDSKVTQPDRALKPYEKTKFQGLGNQGLITDPFRGTTSASARREAPSSVFGILTPGPAIDATAAPANIRRKGGSAFIMDDAIGSEYVQLTTKSGAQVRLDETHGFVYMINRDGTSWIQMDDNGNIDIFGAGSISMRAQTDINLRADRNVNIEAGQNIFMKAAKDTITSTTAFTYDINNIPVPSTIPYYKYVGQGAGEGGNIVTQSLGNYHTTVTGDMFQNVKGNTNSIVTGNIVVNSTGAIDFKSGSPITIQAEFVDISTSESIKMRGSSLDVTAPVTISGLTQLNSQLLVSGGLTAASPVILGGSIHTSRPFPPSQAASAVAAEVRQAINKINILAGWSDPTSKFQRLSESIQTTVSRFATYEPCPEHETFTFSGVSGYTPVATEGAQTYLGSGSPGNPDRIIPPPNTDPGANNTALPPTPADQSVISKSLNIDGLKCQLKFHEGVRYVSYPDLVLPGGIDGGVAHLMRTNEKPLYPIGTAISVEQVNTWLEQDIIFAITGAQKLLGIDIWNNLSDIRKRACADLCYNLGQGTLSKFKRFLAAMKVGDYNAAGQSLRESKWFTQVGRRATNIITEIVQNVNPISQCNI